MARDKGFEQRMQGMVYACRLAQEQGIEALVKDVKQRGEIGRASCRERVSSPV